MNPLILIIMAPFALAVSACSTGTVDSTQVNADAVHEEYSVTYAADSNQMNLWAQFRVGDSTGTTVHLSSPAQLTVNSRKVSSTNFLGTYYSIDYANGFLTSSNVVYTDSNGAAHAYTATLTPIAFLTTNNTIVPTGANFVVQLQGSTQASDETITATIYQSSQGANQSSATLYGHYDSSMNRMVFYSSDLQTLQAGTATLRIQRSRSASFASGWMQMVYDAGSRTLQITR